MHITVVSGDSWWESKRVIAELQEMGYEAERVDHSFITLDLNAKPPVLVNGQKWQTDYIYHTADFNDGVSLEAIELLSRMLSVKYNNHRRSVEIADSKFLTYEVPKRQNIPTPKTYSIKTKTEAETVASKLGWPVVLKRFYGDSGIGVALIRTKRDLNNVDASWWLDSGLLVQECISESAGRDIRVIVVQGKVVAAVERRGGKGQFKANIAHGGSAHTVELSAEEKDLAVRATKAVGLDICGVDLMRSRRGPLVIELNAAPGFIFVTRSTEINVARVIAEFIVESASSPKQL